jgi:hypothetical protein
MCTDIECLDTHVIFFPNLFKICFQTMGLYPMNPTEFPSLDYWVVAPFEKVLLFFEMGEKHPSICIRATYTAFYRCLGNIVPPFRAHVLSIFRHGKKIFPFAVTALTLSCVSHISNPKVSYAVVNFRFSVTIQKSQDTGLNNFWCTRHYQKKKKKTQILREVSNQICKSCWMITIHITWQGGSWLTQTS